MTAEGIRQGFLEHIHFSRGKVLETSTAYDRFYALAYAVRDRLVDRWVKTQRTYYAQDVKRAYYLSAEFLLGRALGNNLHQPRPATRPARSALAELGVDLDDAARDRSRTRASATAASGGSPRASSTRWRRSACPGYGYGIRYEFGIFEQEIRDGYQVERADEWLQFGNPWEIVAPGVRRSRSRFGGHVEHVDRRRRRHVRALGRRARRCSASRTTRRSPASATNTVNTLRLWQARASATSSTSRSSTTATTCARSRRRTTREVISKVLYPNDHIQAGQGAAPASRSTSSSPARSRDIVRRYKKTPHRLRRSSPTKVAIQLNDTHPAIAVAELMRVLVDEKRVAWDARVGDHRRDLRLHEPHAARRGARDAGRSRCSSGSCRATCEIIYEINRRFLRAGA